MRSLAALLLCLFVLPASARAGSSSALVQDCRDGHIDGGYSVAQLQQAQRDLPTDVDEYTDCRDVLHTAQVKAASRRASAAGARGGGGAVPGPQGVGSAAQPGSAAASRAAGAATPAAGGSAAAPAPTAAAHADGAGAAVAADVAAGAGAGASPLAPVAAVSARGQDVPATLAGVLVVLGAALLLGAWVVRRRHRRVA